MPRLSNAPFARNIDDVEYVPDAWHPGQVLDGEPEQATAVLWESADGKAVRGFWRVTPGIFSWEFAADELFVVHSGQAKIKVEGGESFTVGPGDIAVFAPGDRTIWHVTETIRKAFHIGE